MQFNFYPFDNITIDMNILLMYLLAGVCLYDLLVGPFCIVQFVFIAIQFD